MEFLRHSRPGEAAGTVFDEIDAQLDEGPLHREPLGRVGDGGDLHHLGIAHYPADDLRTGVAVGVRHHAVQIGLAEGGGAVQREGHQLVIFRRQLFRRFVAGLPDGLLQSSLRFGAAAGIGLVGPREKQVADDVADVIAHGAVEGELRVDDLDTLLIGKNRAGMEITVDQRLRVVHKAVPQGGNFGVEGLILIEMLPHEVLVAGGDDILVPGVHGFSENIRVISIVGQLLEHSRIFIFENNSNPLYYMGSADWMPRNLDRRVELVFPVEDEDIKKRVQEVITVSFKDTVNARQQLSTGVYKSVDKRGKHKTNCQKFFSKLALKAQKQAMKKTYASTVGTPIVPVEVKKEDSEQ